MSLYIPKIIKEVSRDLRKNLTNSEKMIWEEIRNKKLWYKFLRQKPIYLYTEYSWLDRCVIPDFYCSELRLILEIDWSIHTKKEIYLLDLEKEKLLWKKWINVIRVTNNEIIKNISTVINKIILSFP